MSPPLKQSRMQELYVVCGTDPNGLTLIEMHAGARQPSDPTQQWAQARVRRCCIYDRAIHKNWGTLSVAESRSQSVGPLRRLADPARRVRCAGSPIQMPCLIGLRWPHRAKAGVRRMRSHVTKAGREHEFADGKTAGSLLVAACHPVSCYSTRKHTFRTSSCTLLLVVTSSARSIRRR